MAGKMKNPKQPRSLECRSKNIPAGIHSLFNVAREAELAAPVLDHSELRARVPHVMNVVAGNALDPSVPEKIVDREREIILAEKRGRSGAEPLVYCCGIIVIEADRMMVPQVARSVADQYPSRRGRPGAASPRTGRVEAVGIDRNRSVMTAEAEQGDRARRRFLHYLPGHRRSGLGCASAGPVHDKSRSAAGRMVPERQVGHRTGRDFQRMMRRMAVDAYPVHADLLERFAVISAAAGGGAQVMKGPDNA